MIPSANQLKKPGRQRLKIYFQNSNLNRVNSLFLSAAMILIVGILLIECDRPKEYKPRIQSDHPEVIQKWVEVFTPSVLSYSDRLAELQWFQDVTAEFRGDTLISIGEDIETSYWESQVLARAFAELTGIYVEHHVTGEEQIVDLLLEQLTEDHHLYDIYVTDADLVGTHLRLQKIVVLSDYMNEEGRQYTNPYLDLDDFLNLEFGQDYNGHQLQIPDYQFALVYWFRYDWFTDPQIKAVFREEYGYELGVPLNWAAYEDIAQFFTGRKLQNANGSTVTVWGHADYARPGPWLGWRFSDAFFSIAGMGDPGLPNGLPVDEWGIRVIDQIPRGASVERGGALNSPAAVYGLTKWIRFLEDYAPPNCYQLDWLDFGARAAVGDIAQTWYWTSIYSALNSAYNQIGSPVCDREGQPLWRIAPVPRGKYWQEGMKMGYQDAGSWAIPEDTQGRKRHMAWIWAQFCLSKSAAIKKFLVGGTPVRKSTLYSDHVSANLEKYGGMVEFYRSDLIKMFTDSGPNVPHYPLLSGLWWRSISQAISGEMTPREALNQLAARTDSLMGTLQMSALSPNLNAVSAQETWLSKPGAPKPEISQPQEPRTIDYDEMIRLWQLNP